MKEANNDAGRVKITAGLYLLSKYRRGAEVMKKVPQVYFSLRFDETRMIYDALGEILVDAQEFHQKSFPLAKPIQRSHVVFYAHESAAKCYRLAERMVTGTVRDFFDHFKDHGYLTKLEVSGKQLEIRLVCDEDQIHDLPDPDVHHRDSSIQSGSILSGKRKLSSASASNSGMRNVRTSAWRPPTSKISFVRNPIMVPYTFRRSVSSIDGPDITFLRSETIETILIAKDWQEGWEKTLRKEDYSNSGYIGQGTSKRVIYARFGDVEYALGQLHGGGCSKENAHILQTEYENLVQGEAFREGFEELALEYSTPLPKFYFNLVNAILGRFVDNTEVTDSPPDAPCGLPYWDFIATRLLPCGPIDGFIEKFTGSDNVGPSPGLKEHLTITLHAFTHYVAVFSRGNLLICDLQGMYDKAGTMCLIDPQSHSSEPSRLKRVYWDGGPQAIEHFMLHHLKDCPKNAICNALQLRIIEFDDSDGNYDESPINHSKSVSPRKQLTRTRNHHSSEVNFEKENPLRIGWD